MKKLVKGICDGLALLLVLPPALLYGLGCLVLGPRRAFPGWSQALSLLPGFIGVYLRRAFYRLVLPRCGADSCISFGTIFSHPTVEIGRTVYVGAFCCIGDVTLEDDVLIASHVSITNGSAQHGTERLDIPIREQPGSYPRITIGRDSWIGDRAVIMADVGKHCIVGAGSVVTKPLPDYAVAVGVPARVVRYRNEQPADPEAAPEADVSSISPQPLELSL
ncbi:MAG: acyltransferase [Gemmataceae bacterium]|nr:acyltransferase [Gemmataceae bacterium]